MRSPATFLPLLRPGVSLGVAAGSLFGALYHGGPDWHPSAMTALGAGVLCSACSALNQVQERCYDRRMERTRHRPVASGALSVRTALVTSLLLFALGLMLFFVAGGIPLTLLGLAVPLIYNGLYTPLKPITPMALLVGGVSGAMPPLTGWVGAGGNITDPPIVAVTALFFLWQVPHFWLLHEKHRSDYARAGFAMLEARMPKGLYRPLLGLWVGAYFVALGLLAYTGGSGSANWLLPPAVLLMGGGALLAVARNHRRGASALIYGSLPLCLTALLLTT